MATSKKLLPGLTDWVLWTRHPLTKSDQNWFYALGQKPHLHLWTSSDADILLSGEATILRQTFFGELVLSPATLAQQHKLTVASIRGRWLPEVHQRVEAERTLRRMLGELSSWSELLETATRLEVGATVVAAEKRARKGQLSSCTAPFLASAAQFSAVLRDVHALLDKGDLELIRDCLEQSQIRVPLELSVAPRRLRAAGLPCSLEATNMYSDMKLAVRQLANSKMCVETREVAVLADAGGGKTQLAAHLTAPQTDRPAGVLLYGRDLLGTRTLNDLARTVAINGRAVQSIEELIAALDAAGRRAGRRLPLVFDGLNEAEDPRTWKPLLAALDQLLLAYPSVLVVCTLRTGSRRPQDQRGQHARAETEVRETFAKQALPEEMERIEIPDFGDDLIPAIRGYFAYFKINASDADLPWELLSHPLTLRIFCEVTNPTRATYVGIEAMPRSLTGLFDRYVSAATERIAELAPLTHRYFEQDVRQALHFFGTALWTNKARSLSESYFRREIRDEGRPWDRSLVPMLEQEGLILRVPGDAPGELEIIPVYDALGGHLVADALVTNLGGTSIEAWLGKSETVSALQGHQTDAHPLSIDIFRALVGLLPRRLHGKQLWQLLAGELRNMALDAAATLEASYLDSTTVTALAERLAIRESRSSDLFRRLFHMRGAVNHPLNATFLDSVLRQLDVGARDLFWTEWVRRNDEWVMKDVNHWEQRWRASIEPRTPTDQLRARWIVWLLSTTIHKLRDRATSALYWFGRGDPIALFSQVESVSSVNDPYVYERALAASYGVAMALHSDPTQGEFRLAKLASEARKIFALMFRANAPARTTHEITRDYGRSLIELAAARKRGLFTNSELAMTRPPYSNGGQVLWPNVKPGEPEIYGLDSPFRMDFQNYILGDLVIGRNNYDFKHSEYLKIRAKVLWRIEQLGWSADAFKQVEREIESRDEYRHFGRSGNNFGKIDRYGKKYSWIAYFELRGWLSDSGQLRDDGNPPRSPYADIDPSFPNAPPKVRWIKDNLLGRPTVSFENWIKQPSAPATLLNVKTNEILATVGPWVALHGYVEQQDEALGRRMFAFTRCYLLAKKDLSIALQLLARQEPSDRWSSDPIECQQTFSGELPWCRTIPDTVISQLRLLVEQKMVKVRKKRRVILLDGEPLDAMDLGKVESRALADIANGNDSKVSKKMMMRISITEQTVELEELRQKFKKIAAIVPIYTFNSVGQDSDGATAHGAVLAKKLAKAARLWNIPQTLDLQTEDGVRATINTAYRDKIEGHEERFFFIRSDILNALLRKLDMNLVVTVWGERGRSVGQLQQQRYDKSNAKVYSRFQSARRL